MKQTLFIVFLLFTNTLFAEESFLSMTINGTPIKIEKSTERWNKSDVSISDKKMRLIGESYWIYGLLDKSTGINETESIARIELYIPAAPGRYIENGKNNGYGMKAQINFFGSKNKFGENLVSSTNRGDANARDQGIFSVNYIEDDNKFTGEFSATLHLLKEHGNTDILKYDYIKITNGKFVIFK